MAAQNDILLKMEKDYFQDILPPQGSTAPKPPPPREVPPPPNEPPQNARSIRNITVSPRAPRRMFGGGDMHEGHHEAPPPPPKHHRRGPRMWIWIVAVVFIAILGAIFALAMRPTKITVIPRTQGIVFDSSLLFSAQPAQSAALGALPYTVQTTELEDSAVVSAEGTENVQEKASGTITVFNEYSALPVRLIENTRFETPDGLIFRTPSEILVPGRTGDTPGQISVTVIADQEGERYNVGPISRFTLPGLRGTSDMYADIYARSTTSMSGGFSGTRPAVAPAALESTKAEMRGRLEQKARAAAEGQQGGASVVLHDLVKITYTTLPATPEAGGQVRLHERAVVEIPIFPAEAFAQTVARGVSADAEEGGIVLRGVENLAASLAETEEAVSLGTTPFAFSLSGTAQVVWNVDTAELAEALAGREKAAFQALIAGFPGIEEARARIQPFWSSTFPSEPSAIQVVMEEPALPGA